MKSGIYYRGKLIEFDPTQLDVKEKCFILYEPYELEEPSQPDTFIAEKVREVQHESGAVIHYHLHKPAPARVRKLIRRYRKEIRAPRMVEEGGRRIELKGLKNIIAHLKREGEL